MELQEFERIWKEFEGAFHSENKMRAISVIRWVIPGGILAAKNYVERYWRRPDGLELMREDLMSQMGVKKQGEGAEQKPQRVIQKGRFQLIITGEAEVAWDEIDDFFSKVATELYR